MIDARFITLSRWIGEKTPNHKRERSRFRAPYAGTLDLLEDELKKLNASDITVEAEFQRSDIRIDGWPRSNARPSGPAIILSFEKLKHGWKDGRWTVTERNSVAMPCDRFDDWQDNLRAIALSLQALRAVDRYGVTRSGEQYRGFAQLPAAEEKMTVDRATRVLAAFCNGVDPDHIRADREAFRKAYRSAAAITHPDNAASGDREAFLVLQEAKAVLEGVHGKL